MNTISAITRTENKISGLKHIRNALLLTAVISGAVLTRNIYNIKSDKKAQTELTNNEIKLPFISGTLFSLGLLGGLGTNSARKKEKEKLNNLNETRAKELGIPFEIYKSIMTKPKIKSGSERGEFGATEYNVCYLLIADPKDSIEGLERIINFWKKEFNLNILDPESETKIMQLIDDVKIGKTKASDICWELSETFKNGLIYPGIEHMGLDYNTVSEIPPVPAVLHNWDY